MKKYRDKITGLIDRFQNIAIVRMVQGVMGIFSICHDAPDRYTIFAGDSGRICGIDRRNHSR